MRIKQILVAFLFTALIISCGNKAKDIDVSEKAKDINVKELETECDILDAMEIVMDEIIVLGEAVDSEEGVLGAITYGFEGSKEQKKEYKLLGEKAEEINERADELGFKGSEDPDCPNFETVKKKGKKAKKLRKVFR